MDRAVLIDPRGVEELSTGVGKHLHSETVTHYQFWSSRPDPTEFQRNRQDAGGNTSRRREFGWRACRSQCCKAFFEVVGFVYWAILNTGYNRQLLSRRSIFVTHLGFCVLREDPWNPPTVGLVYTTVPPIHLGSDVLSRNTMILCTSIFIRLGSLHKDPLAMYGPLAANFGILCYKVFGAWRNHTANHAEKNSPGLPLFSDPQQVMTSSTHCTEFCIEALGEETTATL